MEGTVSRDGDMTHFVAENLEYKIKLSSPITKKGTEFINFHSKRKKKLRTSNIIENYFFSNIFLIVSFLVFLSLLIFL